MPGVESPFPSDERGARVFGGPDPPAYATYRLYLTVAATWTLSA